MPPRVSESSVATDGEQQQQQQERQTKQRHKQQPQRGLGRSRVATSGAAAAALGAAAAYLLAQSGIRVFHLARRAYLRQLLLDVGAALSSLDRCWWLDFGSLLGIYRDNDLILHDNDIDVAVLLPPPDADADPWPALLAELRRALPQYRVRVVFPSEDPSTRFIRVYCPLGMADVFGATPVGDHGDRLLVDCGHGPCTEIDRRCVLPTGVLQWRGAAIACPGDVPAALVQRYGEGWRVPAYMDKGSDTVEGQKGYAKVFRALATLGIRL